MASEDTPDIMNVREIIESAFGDFERNTVNFKLVQTVLYLIARQLRILERRVLVELGTCTIVPSESSLSVTEVKIHAIQKTKKKTGMTGAKHGTAGARPGVTGTKPGGTGAKSGITGTGVGVGAGAASKKQKTGQEQSSSSDKNSSDKTTSADQTTSTDKTTTTSTDKTTSTSTDKRSSDKTTSSDKTSTDKTTSSRTTSHSDDSAQKRKLASYSDILNTFEEQRERELRIIHQRTDSFEEPTKSPTPMASISTLQPQYEKLLIVRKVPSAEARSEDAAADVHGRTRTPQLSLVTQEQFIKVADTVRQLEKRLLPVGTPRFADNIELMHELRKGASLTDAMAALQLSARLEATEKALTQMISMVTELAIQTPGVELDSQTQAFLGITGGTLGKGVRGDGASKATGFVEGAAGFSGGASGRGRSKRQKGARVDGQTSMVQRAFTMSGTEETTEMSEAPEGADTGTAESSTGRCVTYEDLEIASNELYDELLNKLKSITTHTKDTAENALKLSMKLESKLDSSINVSARMAALEDAVKQYADQITALDTGLTSQMTNYQDQLTQMEHDLEAGLDTMAEVLGNTGGDLEAVTELHTQFTNLKEDFEITTFRQKELKEAQNATAYDLEKLWKEIEILRDTKSDREEVADALRDKAGIGELNGLVSLLQFDAVQGDFERRIGAAYSKFNNQENVWQKAIDEMIRLLNEKADLVQVQSLDEDFHKHINKIKDRMQVISDIVGEPKSAMLSKKVFRDTACLSCGSPAHMDMEEPNKVPALPKFSSNRTSAERAEGDSQTHGGGDYGLCYPGLPIPHPKDPRSHLCKRYCGGSHTMVTDNLNRAPPGITVQQALKPLTTAPGTDGKLYLVDEETEMVPCLACNVAKSTPASPTTAEHQTRAPIESIDEFENISLTPPVHELSYN